MKYSFFFIPFTIYDLDVSSSSSSSVCNKFLNFNFDSNSYIFTNHYYNAESYPCLNVNHSED